MPTQSFPLLFTPIRIGRVELRNRIAFLAHGTGLPRNFLPSQELIDYYAERAKGGAALIMVGSMQVHPTSPGITNLLCNYDESIIPGLRRITEAVHAHGAKVFAQINHMGLASTARPLPLWSASAVWEDRFGEVAHAMTEDELRELVEAFGSAAARCIEAGMDGITVHAAHGLLLQQFLSPRTNRRKDSYGGGLEGRMKFPIQIIRRVRQVIGPDYPVGMRVSADEFLDGGLTLDDMKIIVPGLVAAAQLDFIDVSAGHDGFDISGMLHEPPMGIPPGNLAPLAAGIREVVDVPVFHATRINSPVLAERLLQEGATDVIGMVRALIADPHLPNKARAGLEDDINPCVGCEQGCYGRIDAGKHVTCIGNPVSGRETEWASLVPAEQRKKIVVVGGGVAGMEAAIIAARRGHHVTLFERNTQLGGQVLIAAKAPTRDEFLDIVRHRERQLKGLGVQVRLGVEATASIVLDEAPDAVVVATGASPLRPHVPGGQNPNVLTIQEALNQPEAVGERVLVIDYDNRERGATVADFLSERGKTVEMTTEGPHIGYRMQRHNHTFLYQRLMDKGVILTPHTQVMEFEDRRARVRNMFTGAERSIEDIDTFVAVTPGAVEDHLFTELKGRVGEIYAVGDCYTPRDAEAAILDGHRVGRLL